MSTKVRRGVHMTASSRKARPAWRDDEDAALPEEEREESRKQWGAVEEEVEQVRQKLRAMDKPTLEEQKKNAVLAYEDVAGEGADEAEEEARRRRLLEESRSAPSATTPPVALQGADTVASRNLIGNGVQEAQVAEYGPSLPPEAAVTAGQGSQAKKRGGEKKTGAAKRRKREEEDDDDDDAEDEETGKKRKKKADAEGTKRKKKKDEDPDRWVKLKLVGDEKMKRIDATRVVHYHDFDSRGTSTGVDSETTTAPAGNFRASLRQDLWDNDSEEEGEK